MIFIELYRLVDMVEISFFIFFFYMLHTWLFNQEKKTLLLYLYAYESFLMITYSAELHALFFFIGSCFPLAMMLFILFHQTQLQKMFIVPQRLDPLLTTNNTSNWIDELIKYSLTQLNENKDFRVVIEYKDTIASLLYAHEEQHAHLKKNTLDLLYNSIHMPPESFLWLSHQGKIYSLCAQWKDFLWHDTHIITEKTDCIAMYTSSITRRYTIIKGSQIFEHVSAHHAHALLTEFHHTFNHKENRNDTNRPHPTPYQDTTISY